MASDALTYAIGDIHGCADLLDALLDKIEAHAAGRPRELVFLGDYIDRGPGSDRVIESLRKLQWREGDAVICLMGNHEAMLLKTLQERGALDLWLQNGGAETLAAFGADGPEDLPTDVLDWIEALPTLHQDASHWYVHAGFRPDATVPDPDIESRLWIREPFLSEAHDFGRHVVHGHTPLPDGRPEVHAHRTNLDTGAVFGGALTAGVFTPDRAEAVEFLAVQAS